MSYPPRAPLTQEEQERALKMADALELRLSTNPKFRLGLTYNREECTILIRSLRANVPAE